MPERIWFRGTRAERVPSAGRARDERVAQLRSCLNDARRNMQRLFEGNGSLLAQLEHVAGKKNRAERVLGRITPLEETSEGRRGLRQLEAAS